jgi:glycosyltransferase involved in cell wall biosynthesis
MSGPRLVIDALAARFGGTAYAAIQTARQLAQCDSFSEVVVVARQGSIVADGLEPGGRLRLLSLPSASTGELVRRLVWEALALPRQLEQDRPAVVLTWSGMLPRRLSASVACFISNPLMFERDGFANRLRRGAVRRTASADACVVAPSAAMATLASEALGIPVALVPYGVDHARFSPGTEPGDEILCVADFYRHKRHDIVLDAWAALPEPRPTLRLIGDPRVDAATYRQVLASVDRYRNLGTIQVGHHVGLTELVAAYRRARTFVIASEHESFCMPLLEALACGVPAVARDLPALRETGGPGTRLVAGDDVEQWSAELGALVADHDAHKRARELGVEHAAGFAWEHTAAELRDLVLSGESRATAPTRSWRSAPTLASCAIGAAVPLSGFQPFNNAGHVLRVDSAAGLVIAMPATVIALVALAAAIVWPSSRRAEVPAPLIAGAAVLFAGAWLSLIGSDRVADTFVQVITAVVAPLCVFIALRRSALPLRPLGLAFTTIASLLLLRADVVFFTQRGWPTGTHLLQAKQSFEPGDFHYYGLQNPVATAIFAVTLLTFAALWLLREPRRDARAVLAGASVVSILTLYLLYERIGIALALVIAGYVLVKLPAHRLWRAGGAAALAAVLAVVVVTGPGTSSQLDLLATSGKTRAHSLSTGLGAIADHPLTGLGLGWSFRAPSHQPAHSAVIQAGVEMGLLAMVGVAILTVWFLVAGFQALRNASLGGMRFGALVACSVYALYTLIAGGVDAGIDNGLVSVWALMIALLAVCGLTGPTRGASARRASGSIVKPVEVRRWRGQVRPG